VLGEAGLGRPGAVDVAIVFWHGDGLAAGGADGELGGWGLGLGGWGLGLGGWGFGLGGWGLGLGG
jgi:hypothetical protein